MSIESTSLYQEMVRRAPEVPAGPDNLVHEFERLQTIVKEHGKYIILLFPEYTPHDHSRHLDQLFALADRVLGTPLYTRLSAVELLLLAFGLYAHDWGMAVSESERQSLLTEADGESFPILPDEPSRARAFISDADRAGISSEVAWRDYARLTHGLRSGARLRRHLKPLGAVFAEAVAKIAEGHTMALREVRDPDRYSHTLSVFGETVNIAAITTYVRMLDLLDVGEDRTPYTLWTFVAPADPISGLEWQKHRSLSPVAVRQGSTLRDVLISGHTDDSAVFAALADLQVWIDEQFAGAIAQLRMIGGKYNLDIDSRITWDIEAIGFKPLSVRFELDRREVLGLLSGELYEDDSHAFIRELLQNSVDAIDMREALLAKHALSFKGEIRVSLTSNASGLCIEWSDNGIGMDEDTLASYFARPGQCWYRSPEATRVASIDAISQFGIGILSVFAVSDTLTLETQIDPHVDGTRIGLTVKIPTRDSHFRISTATGLQVGTTLHLEIPSHSSSIISRESVCAALKRIARYVRHRIEIECDGVTVEAGLLAKTGNAGGSPSSGDVPGLDIIAMQGDSAEILEDSTTKISFDIGQPGGTYHGHYSAIAPKRPSEVSEPGGHMLWSLGDKSVDLSNILVNSEAVLFVKGIQTGVVSNRGSRIGPNLLGLRYTNWIRPRLLINVSRPSSIHFNLARSSAQLKSKDWIEEAWREIASKLRTSAYNWPLESAADYARLLGACAVFGAVPDSGLAALAETNKCPLLVLQAGKGLTWTFLGEFAQDEQFFEAPFELAYTDNNSDSLEIGRPSGLEGWAGDDALFPLDGLSSRQYPWLQNVVEFGHKSLARIGWCPAEISMVRPPKKESAPLVCRVWRKSANIHRDYAWGEEVSREGSETSQPWSTLRTLYAEAPEVLQFPQSMAQYAAFGSRYWNSEHPKIIAILPVLTKLTEWTRLHRLSTDGEREVSHIASHDFYGYVVPARFTSVNLGLEVPNRLLDVSQKEGLPCSERLVLEDFVPETIGKYRNPYHYDLSEWKNPGMGLGQRLD